MQTILFNESEQIFCNSQTHYCELAASKKWLLNIHILKKHPKHTNTILGDLFNYFAF